MQDRYNVISVSFLLLHPSYVTINHLPNKCESSSDDIIAGNNWGVDRVIVPPDLYIYILDHGVMSLLIFPFLFASGANEGLFQRRNRRRCQFRIWNYIESRECGNLMIIVCSLYSDIGAALHSGF